MEEETQKRTKSGRLPTLREVLGLPTDPIEEGSSTRGSGRPGEDSREALEPHWYRVLSAQARARETGEEAEEAPES